MPLTNYTLEGTMTIDSVSMHRDAWAIIGDESGKGGLLHLWATFDVRGQDRLLPSAAGVVPYPRRITKTEHDLRLLITGDVDDDGDPVANPIAGLEANLEYLRANVVAPVGTGDGTRTAVLTMPSGATRTADIHVLRLNIQSYQLSRIVNGCAQGAIAIATLRISIPEGRFS